MSEESDANNVASYRFSGYNLPMIQLDETGPAYYYIPTPHPYYSEQSTPVQNPPPRNASWVTTDPNNPNIDNPSPVPKNDQPNSKLYSLNKDFETYPRK